VRALLPRTAQYYVYTISRILGGVEKKKKPCLYTARRRDNILFFQRIVRLRRVQRTTRRDVYNRRSYTVRHGPLGPEHSGRGQYP